MMRFCEVEDIVGMSPNGSRTILHGVPEGKQEGFCQMPEQEFHDTGVVVCLQTDCAGCRLFCCLMFGTGWTDPDGTIHKDFTPHSPEYRALQSP